MNTTYWNLFWTTGMPEAWLMSRNGAGPAQAQDSALLGEKQAMFGPLGFQPDLSDNAPMGIGGPY